MIQAFKRSRFAFAAVMVLSAAIAVAIWFRDKDYPIYIPIIASSLMLGIGYFSARVLGNILANMENTRYLGYLHMELDPEKFLAHYEDVPGRLKADGSSAAICRSYLADGYAAKGDFDAAIATLSVAPPVDNLPVQGLYAANLSACYLGKGDLERAQASIRRLEEVIDACRLNKPELAKNLTESLQLHRQHFHCLTGEAVDTEWLEAAFDRAQYHIRRLEIAKVLAQAALRDGDGAEAKKQLTYLRKNGGKTFFKRWADQQKDGK